MPFKKYNKILSYLDKDGTVREECEGILSGTVYIQEKIDGANLSVWLQNGNIHIGSRNNDVTEGSFNGAVEYIKSHKGILELLNKNPNMRLYGEWLVPHTIRNYNPVNYNHFYLFDIEYEDKFISIDEIYTIADKFNIKTPKLLAKINNPKYSDIEKLAGTSDLGPKGEGVVIKNNDFINKFYINQYAKIVTKEFKEDNGVTFGSVKKDDTELKLVTSFINKSRIEKIINKIEQNEDRDISIKDISKIIGLVYHDILTEEIKTIAKQGVVDFNRLNKLSSQRTALIAKTIITRELISVAFNN